MAAVALNGDGQWPKAHNKLTAGEMTMPTREALEQVLDRLPEESVREVLDFASFVALQREREGWHSAARTRFAEAYGPDEPEYTETMVKPELDQ